jgi:signal peptidase II
VSGPGSDALPAGPYRAAWALLTLAVVALDQASKWMVRSALPLHESVPVIPGLFHLTHITNRGALFGMLHDLADPWRGAIFTAVPVLAAGLILWFQARTPAADRLAQCGLSLVLAGAVGNLVDRLRFGHVTDFLDVFVGRHHWPAFNVADSAICVGVGFLLLDILRRRPRTAAAPPQPDPSHASRSF